MLIKEHELDQLQRGLRGEMLSELGEHHASAPIKREAGDARADRGECNRAQAVLGRALQ